MKSRPGRRRFWQRSVHRALSKVLHSDGVDPVTPPVLTELSVSAPSLPVTIRPLNRPRRCRIPARFSGRKKLGGGSAYPSSSSCDERYFAFTMPVPAALPPAAPSSLREGAGAAAFEIYGLQVLTTAVFTIFKAVRLRLARVRKFLLKTAGFNWS